MKLKKIIAYLFLAVSALCLAFTLLSCEEDHTHSFGEWTVLKEPSCVSEGEKKQTCSCGAENVEKIPMLTAHSYSGGDCSVCGYECPHIGVLEGVCSSCGATEQSYTVKVTDGLGNAAPMTLVYIYRGEEQLGMNFTDADGEVSFTLMDGKHTFKIESPDSTLTYDADKCVLSASERTKTIALYNTLSEKRDIYAEGETFAYFIGGNKAYSISFGKNETSYFIFSAELTGIYKFTVISDSAVKLGYFGNPDYVLQNDVTKAENRDNDYTIRIDVAPANLAGDQREASKYIIGVFGDGAEGEGVLLVERVAEHEMRPVDYPWQTYGGGLNPEFYCPDGSSLPGFTLVDFDLTNPELKIVFNEADGYYHYMTADGPVVLMKLDISTKYLESAISKMAETQAFACYLYNEDGTYREKLTFQEMLLKYIAACSLANGGVGAYPLDEHLMKMIKDIGNAWGWYDLTSNKNTQIFGEDSSKIVAENAWMFALCYAEVAEAEHRVTLVNEGGEPIVGANVTVTDDEGISLAEAKTDADGIAILTFKHLSDCYVKIDAKTLEDYTVNENDLKLEGVKTTITLTAVNQDGGSSVNKYNPEEKYARYNWDTANIIIQINENSDLGGYPSSLRRYLAGESADSASTDLLIMSRNNKAAATAKTKVTYKYKADGDKSYSWGSAGGSIVADIFANGAKAPDVYIDSGSELVNASLKGCFFNILTEGTENNFSLIEEGYKNSEKSYGYCGEIMSALSPSKNKQYILASDYLPDTVRGVSVTAMNTGLLETLGADGEKTLQDFHKAVMDGEWTYSYLISLSEWVSNKKSDCAGFVFESRDTHQMSALLYSAAPELFEREYDKKTDMYSLDFLNTGSRIEEFSENYTKLFASSGIVLENGAEDTQKSRFISHGSLFSGIIPIAALENEDYKEIANSGIYIAPIPKMNSTDSYRGSIDARASFAAVNRKSTKIAETSAYLDYQSTHSEEIISSYCLYSLLWGKLGASPENKESLELIRASAHLSYSSVYERAVDYYFADLDPSLRGVSWSELLAGLDKPNSELLEQNIAKRQKYMEILIKTAASL